MKRKYVAILPGVLAMVLLLALACSTEEPTVAPVAAQPTEQMAAPADEQSRLDIIKARGNVLLQEHWPRAPTCQRPGWCSPLLQHTADVVRWLYIKVLN